MKLLAFRIENFKSIVDTDWCNLTKDGISCLIGQNESGKSSVLEALYCYHTKKIDPDFIRSDMSIPKVSCVFETNKEEVLDMLKDFKEVNQYEALLKALEKLDWKVNKVRRAPNKDNKLFNTTDLNKEIEDVLFKNIINKKATEYLSLSDDEKVEYERLRSLNWVNFLAAWHKYQPNFVLFNDEYNLLPNEMALSDILGDEELEGKQAVLNLLDIANIDMEKLESGNVRAVKQYMALANKGITIKIQDFWTQKVGNSGKISIEIELKNRDASDKQRAGEPYLQFWIKDEEHALHPKQRSKGVRWFLSFYLSLKADSMREGVSKSIFLIDEPGANLHARAQEDVLKVFEDIRKSNQIIYTTHSQHLVEFENMHRLLAVQRKDDNDDSSASIIIPGHHLGSASSNTLAPILEHMGINFSNQNVISKEDNILLEEVSAMYYLQAFSLFFNKNYHFLPATGVSNVEQLALLFTGWGLGFGIVFDDDSAGRKAYQSILKNLYNGNDTEAKKHIFRIKRCDGIEDLFHKDDFVKFLIRRPIPSEFNGKQNSEIAKLMKLSKAVVAFNFLIDVRSGDVVLSQLHGDTRNDLNSLFASIELVMKNQ